MKASGKSFEQLLAEQNLTGSAAARKDIEEKANAYAIQLIDKWDYRNLWQIENIFGIKPTIKLSQTQFPQRLLREGIKSNEAPVLQDVKRYFPQEANIFSRVKKKDVLMGIAYGTFISNADLQTGYVEVLGSHPQEFFDRIGYVASFSKKDISDVFTSLLARLDKKEGIGNELEKIIGLTLHLRDSDARENLEKRRQKIYAGLLEEPHFSYFALAYAMKNKLGIKPDADSGKYYLMLSKKIDEDNSKGDDWRIRWSARNLIRYSNFFEKPISLDEEKLREIRKGVLKWGLAVDKDKMWGRGYSENDILPGIDEVKSGVFGPLNLSSQDVQEIYKSHLRRISEPNVHGFTDWTLRQIKFVEKLTGQKPVFEKDYVSEVYMGMEKSYISEANKIPEDLKYLRNDINNYNANFQKYSQMLKKKTKESLLHIYDLTQVSPHEGLLKLLM